ncbi:MAG: DUF2442 domain-containing protein [Oscillospiraceae bacterium]|nr:DUF2442 domain-containing protein [Oscillospiraceae bacterium]
MEDIFYGEPTWPRVISVIPLDDYKLLLNFNNGEHRIFDVKPSFQYDVYKPIMDKEVFNLVKVVCDTIEWPGDIDYCPDTLYARSVPVNTDIVAPFDISAVAEPRKGYNI